MTSANDQRLETASGPSRRPLALLIGLLVSLALIVSGAGSASAQNAVGPQPVAMILSVGPAATAAQTTIGVREPPGLRLVSATGVAADTATSALEQGAAKVPGDWGPGLANRKGVGTRWTDPSNPGNGIRIDQGTPGVGGASQQVDHVVVRSGGQILGPDGKPIVGSLAQNPQAHIPLSDWRNWSSWNTP